MADTLSTLSMGSSPRIFKHTAHDEIPRDGEWHLVAIPLPSISTPANFGCLNQFRVTVDDAEYVAGFSARVFDTAAGAEANERANSLWYIEKGENESFNTSNLAPGVSINFDATSRCLWLMMKMGDISSPPAEVTVLAGGVATE